MNGASASAQLEEVKVDMEFKKREESLTYIDVKVPDEVGPAYHPEEEKINTGRTEDPEATDERQRQDLVCEGQYWRWVSLVLGLFFWASPWPLLAYLAVIPATLVAAVFVFSCVTGSVLLYTAYLAHRTVVHLQSFQTL